MAAIVWTKLAKEDMQNIYDYIAENSVFYANRLIDTLENRTTILINQPSAGRVVPEFENELIRELVEGNY